MTPNQILKQYFGYDTFREGQAELIAAILSGQDVLGVMPTGAGKSLCYQVPALLLDGITLVVSPLISLMRDQVQALAANGIPAAFINSSLTQSQWGQVMQNARNGQYKIIYIAPERLLSPSMLELVQTLSIAMVAVDESHCISQWGQDFRPSYLDIPAFVQTLSTRPVLAAFTATATPRVREDILTTLQLKSPFSLVTGFDRPNLYFEVKQPKDKYRALLQFLKERDGNGIIYCSTRKEVESVTAKLIADGYSAAQYHAGLPDQQRNSAQDDFLYDRVKIIVATNAFGMGIDKSNVRFVVHYNMPQNVESYYQEAGRAGRDGLPSDCILFYARKDISTALFLINQSNNPQEIARNRLLLTQMEQYCETDGCLRRYMLHYFGENSTEDCGNCSSCNGDFELTDVTIDAQKVLSHISRLNNAGRRFMFTHTTDIILGKSDDFTQLSTFGIMKGAPRHYIRQLTNRLTALGYLQDDGYLSITPKASEVLFGGVAVTIRGTKPEANETRSKTQAAMYAVSEHLLTQLKELRLTLAKKAKVPAYVIFSDATLVDMCQKHPQTETEMLAVSGVGEVKYKRYGEAFLQLLQAETPAQKQETAPLFSPDLLQKLVSLEEKHIPISLVADHINTILIQYDKPKTSGAKLNKLLLEAGYLQVIGEEKHPTDAGTSHGIITVEGHGQRGKTYTQCLFDKTAQTLCVTLWMQAEL